MPGGPVLEAGADQRVSPWFLANVLLARRRMIITVALVSAVSVGLMSWLSPRRYVVSASFIPQEPKTAQSLLNQLDPQLGITLGRSNVSSPDFYASLLQSSELQWDVVTADYHLTASRRFDGDLIQYLEIKAPSRDQVVTSTLRQLRSMVSVHTDRITGVVGFDVTTKSPELSQQIAERFLDLVNDYNLRRQQSQAKAEREFLEKRLAVAKDSLAVAEDELSKFLVRNRRLEDSPELRAEASRLERQVNLRQQVYLSLNQYYELAKLEEVRNTPVITIIQHPAGFVERKSRRTVLKASAALLLGGLVAVLLAFASERVRRLEGPEFEEYAEFRRGLGDLLSRVRHPLRRRPR